MHRLFVALRPPIAVRQQLVAAMGGIVGARWQDDAQLHITLRYIGRVDPEIAEDAALALQDVRAAPLTLAIAGVGAFEDHGRVDAVWARVTPQHAIARLHHKVDHALVRAGLAPEGRAYRPHVTLARLGKRAGPITEFLADQAMLAIDPFTLDHFLLFESHIGHGGATYEPVARYPLSG